MKPVNILLIPFLLFGILFVTIYNISFAQSNDIMDQFLKGNSTCLSLFLSPKEINLEEFINYTDDQILNLNNEYKHIIFVTDISSLQRHWDEVKNIFDDNSGTFIINAQQNESLTFTREVGNIYSNYKNGKIMIDTDNNSIIELLMEFNKHNGFSVCFKNGEIIVGIHLNDIIEVELSSKGDISISTNRRNTINISSDGLIGGQKEESGWIEFEIGDNEKQAIFNNFINKITENSTVESTICLGKNSELSVSIKQNGQEILISTSGSITVHNNGIGRKVQF